MSKKNFGSKKNFVQKFGEKKNNPNNVRKKM